MDEFWEGDFSDGDIGNEISSGKGGMNSRRISWGGDDCDGDVPLGKKAS